MVISPYVSVVVAAVRCSFQDRYGSRASASVALRNESVFGTSRHPGLRCRSQTISIRHDCRRRVRFACSSLIGSVLPQFYPARFPTPIGLDYNPTEPSW